MGLEIFTQSFEKSSRPFPAVTYDHSLRKTLEHETECSNVFLSAGNNPGVL